MCHQSYICHLLFWSKKIQMESKLACIKVSGIFIDRINNDDSIWKHFNFYLQMLTNFKLSEFRQRTVWVVLISFPLLLQIFSAFFWRTQYWKLSDAKYWTICKIVYTRMADPMILEAFSNLQFSYFFFFPQASVTLSRRRNNSLWFSRPTMSEVMKNDWSYSQWRKKRKEKKNYIPRLSGKHLLIGNAFVVLRNILWMIHKQGSGRFCSK